mmetsp:Transcript_622/g.2038  ORF Transcript_622/g.2038 Transcript_622/m.2038 type:complete len:117 (-) Transcript_622:960-1310(-)
MANDDGDEPVEDNRSQTNKQTAKELDSVTDFVEEKELSSSNKDKVKEAMAALAETNSEKKAATALREKELAAVKIDQADVALLAAELELDNKAAERRLREAGGSAEAALKAFIEAC